MKTLIDAQQFIATASREDLNKLVEAIKFRRQVISQEIKNSFTVGQIVNINHKSCSPTERYKIEKINKKNIVCRKLGTYAEYNVSPALLKLDDNQTVSEEEDKINFVATEIKMH